MFPPRSLSNNERPSLFPYQLKELKELPRRLFRSPKSCASQRVGRVRSFRLPSVYSVRLEDVLAGKHLPPLTLHDFESYLVHDERSSENLYFVLWLNDYTKEYQEWNRSSIPSHYSSSLAYSYRRAKETFFTKSATLELNLNADTLVALSAAAPRAHPPPSSFADVRHQIESMLTESLQTFVRSRSANAGRNRVLFAIFIGLVMMVIGLAPILSSVLQSKSRWLRVAALPCFWFGATTVICGLHGVCIIIFLFGDARQLTAYELACPQVPTTPHYISSHPKRHSQLDCTPSISSKCPGDPETPEPLSDTFDIQKATCDLVQATFNDIPPKLRCDTEAAPFSEHFLRASDVHSPATIAPFLLTPPPEDRHFDLDHLLSSEPGLSPSPPVFGPLTKVLDRICIQTYWETVTRSAALALLAAFILVVIAVAA
ncbi:hypothetical protein JB92DRAFT_498195 [Gautieria morchelliformis]|nr:hypothetical protein JB92DRAFT_498195 [Gautieria morchelliformis]